MLIGKKCQSKSVITFFENLECSEIPQKRIFFAMCSSCFLYKFTGQLGKSMTAAPRRDIYNTFVLIILSSSVLSSTSSRSFLFFSPYCSSSYYYYLPIFPFFVLVCTFLFCFTYSLFFSFCLCAVVTGWWERGRWGGRGGRGWRWQPNSGY